MPVKLNLLPPELAISKNLSNFLKTTKALTVIGLAAFLIFALGTLAIGIVSTLSLNKVNANVVKLKAQVSAQQKSEQGIVLVKDRITKIAIVQKIPSSLPNIQAIEPFLSGLSASSSITQMTIDTNKIDLSLGFKTNSDMSSFIQMVKASDIFKTVNLTSFTLSPTTGYLVEISTVKK